MQKKLMLAVSSNNAKYDIGTMYGPFVHWQACADWLDRHPSVRDGYKWMIVNVNECIDDTSIKQANQPYE